MQNTDSGFQKLSDKLLTTDYLFTNVTYEKPGKTIVAGTSTTWCSRALLWMGNPRMTSTCCFLHQSLHCSTKKVLMELLLDFYQKMSPVSCLNLSFYGSSYCFVSCQPHCNHVSGDCSMKTQKKRENPNCWELPPACSSALDPIQQTTLQWA